MVGLVGVEPVEVEEAVGLVEEVVEVEQAVVGDLKEEGILNLMYHRPLVALLVVAPKKKIKFS